MTAAAGFKPLRDYAAIGNKSTIALVARDGDIDYLCSPRFDSPTIFAALLDPERGGRGRLAVEGARPVSRRYLPGTCVLETTYRGEDGCVRVVDAMTRQTSGRLPINEIVRLVEGVEGRVRVRWSVRPRFDYGRRAAELRGPANAPVLGTATDHVVVQSWDLGEPSGAEDAVEGAAWIAAGDRGLLRMGFMHGEPLLVPERDLVESRIGQTCDMWRTFVDGISYDGPWREEVVRSMLTLELLVYEPTGAMVAAGTTSLPERVGGSRNWDYRYAWLRDTTFTLDAMDAVGHDDQVHATLTWLLRTTADDIPDLRPFYRVDGSHLPADEEELPLRGYRDSRPVRNGNRAVDQLQLGNWGDLLNTALRYVRSGHMLDEPSGRRLAAAADHLATIWGEPDAGIWELRDHRQYTQSLMACWNALTNAAHLAEAGQMPAGGAGRWRAEADRVRGFVNERCWSHRRTAYARHAGSDELDAAVLRAARTGFLSADDPRLTTTIDAVRQGLGTGALVYRYSGMADREGAFLACSFWLVEALAIAGRVDEAVEAMQQLAGLANDVGLYPEEIDPTTCEFCGNLPQAITHLALVNAAVVLTSALQDRDAA